MPTITQLISYSGAYYEFVVPAGNTSIVVDVYGAEGGDAGGVGVPGKGARVQATVAVTPGETLRLYVGGQGPTGAAGSGGFPDGGLGGQASGRGGGGGGSSDIRRAPYGLADRLVVAGGGGGTSGSSTFNSGGNAGENGSAGLDSFGGFQGNGATTTAGGSGGTAFYGTARDGALGQGGPGRPASGSASGGGGGGGGLYGGQGGGETGGGGGGSSGVGTGVTSVTYTSGARSGNGEIRLTYEPASGDSGGEIMVGGIVV